MTTILGRSARGDRARTRTLLRPLRRDREVKTLNNIQTVSAGTETLGNL